MARLHSRDPGVGGGRPVKPGEPGVTSRCLIR